MRAMRKNDGKWVTEAPPELIKWLWANDGGEAVVVDDATQTYYCATEDQMHLYRQKWAEEKRSVDNRKAAMFFDLGQKLFTGIAAP